MIAMMMASAGASKQPQPVIDAGVEYGGGYYAGADIIVDGVQYLVIVAPRSQGEASSALRWKNVQTTTAGTDSRNNGRANTAAMISHIASQHPAARFCNDLVINGHDDWHLPSQDELEICYRYLKPATDSNNTGSGTNPSSVPPTGNYTSGNPSQTSDAIFRSGGGEHFDSVLYWSSTQNSSTHARNQYFLNGSQGGNVPKTNSYRIRAVRWEKRR